MGCRRDSVSLPPPRVLMRKVRISIREVLKMSHGHKDPDERN
jgi:hypothetical protein